MKISINGESHQFEPDTDLLEVLSQYGASEPFVVAVNTEFVPKPGYPQVILNDGDQIDVVQPIQGG